jgi:hypothetical protein
MGAAFWILFVLQIAVLAWGVQVILKLENERPTETIVPATDEDLEVY